jgi:hypothetical protein
MKTYRGKIKPTSEDGYERVGAGLALPKSGAASRAPTAEGLIAFKSLCGLVPGIREFSGIS